MSTLSMESEDNDPGRLYALLNLPRNAPENQVARNFKLLSRVFHPDKSPTQHRESAQRTFVAIRAAADVLSDPIYRLVYNHGGMLAVTLVKRSQSVQYSNEARADNANDTEESDSDKSINLYTLLKKAASEDDAATIVRDVLQEYRHHHQNLTMDKPQWSLSADLYHVHDSQLPLSFQRETASVQLHNQYRLTANAATVSITAGASVESTAQSRITAVVSLDQQPVQGTHITLDTTLLPQPNVSLRTTRHTKSGSVWVVGISGGNFGSGSSFLSKSSWNATLLSYRNLLWIRTNPNVQQKHLASTITTKIQAMWRLAVTIRGQFRHLVVSLRTLEYPVWRCRLGLSTFPVKVSWQGAETDTFYMTLSWGIPFFFRCKLLRINRIRRNDKIDNDVDHDGDSDWTIKYGIKYDGHALSQASSASAVWTIIVQLHLHEHLSLNLPIGLSSSSYAQPHSILVFVATLLVGEFVDAHLSLWGPHFSLLSSAPSTFLNTDADGSVCSTTTTTSSSLHRRFQSVVQVVAQRKRQLESNQSGLVIVQASLQHHSVVTDVADVLQFWIVRGSLHLSRDDARWHLLVSEPPPPSQCHDKSSLISQISQLHNGTDWCNFMSKWWFSFKSLIGCVTLKETQLPSNMRHRSLSIRYQSQDKLYEIYLQGVVDIILPHPNATEIGPADRTR